MKNWVPSKILAQKLRSSEKDQVGKIAVLQKAPYAAHHAKIFLKIRPGSRPPFQKLSAKSSTKNGRRSGKSWTKSLRCAVKMPKTFEKFWKITPVKKNIFMDLKTDQWTKMKGQKLLPAGKIRQKPAPSKTDLALIKNPPMAGKKPWAGKSRPHFR